MFDGGASNRDDLVAKACSHAAHPAILEAGDDHTITAGAVAVQGHAKALFALVLADAEGEGDAGAGRVQVRQGCLRVLLLHALDHDLDVAYRVLQEFGSMVSILDGSASDRDDLVAQARAHAADRAVLETGDHHALAARAATVQGHSEALLALGLADAEGDGGAGASRRLRNLVTRRA